MIRNSINRGEVVVADLDGSVVGYMIHGDKEPASIWFMAVDPDYQGQGIGSDLVNSLEGTVKTWATEESVPFFEANGFSDTGKRKGNENEKRLLVRLGPQAKMEDFV